MTAVKTIFSRHVKKIVETALRFECVVLLDDINAEYITNNPNIMENVVQVIDRVVTRFCMLFPPEDCSCQI